VGITVAVFHIPSREIVNLAKVATRDPNPLGLFRLRPLSLQNELELVGFDPKPRRDHSSVECALASGAVMTELRPAILALGNGEGKAYSFSLMDYVEGIGPSASRRAQSRAVCLRANPIDKPGSLF
jgi:hypothetical protein